MAGETMKINVVSLFGRKLSQGMPATHFVAIGLIALCGMECDGILDKDTTPECEVCRDIWAKATGWSFPLPVIGCVDGA